MPSCHGIAAPLPVTTTSSVATTGAPDLPMRTTQLHVSAESFVQAGLRLIPLVLCSQSSSPWPAALEPPTAQAALLPEATAFRQVVSVDDLGIGSLLVGRLPSVAEALSTAALGTIENTPVSHEKSLSKRRRCRRKKVPASNAATASTGSGASSIENTSFPNSEDDNTSAFRPRSCNDGRSEVGRYLATPQKRGTVTWSDLAADDFVAAAATSCGRGSGAPAGERSVVQILAPTLPVVSPKRSEHAVVPILSATSSMKVMTLWSACDAGRLPISQEGVPSPGWGTQSGTAHAQDWLWSWGSCTQQTLEAEKLLDPYGGAVRALFPEQLQQPVMSTAPAASGKPGAHQCDDALRSWLHASGLPSCTALEEQIRAAAPEIYED